MLTIGVDNWEKAIERLSDEARPAAEAASAGNRDLFEAVLGNSPFLSSCLMREPATFAEFAKEGPDAAFATALAGLTEAVNSDPAREGLDRALRIARRRVALVTALADLSGAWSVDQVTEALTRFADMAVDTALRFHFAAAAMRKADPPPDLGGLFVLAMGKQGAGELNYSSDIDLIVLYEPERVPLFGPDDIGQAMVRVTRNLVASLNERTADGYVFRVDLRLRPDPGSTPVAMSVPAALTYYEGMGQNWERAAMIRARPCAGDLDAGQAFLEELHPFIWRRSMDFYAIQDVHSIKRQIHAQKGGAEVAIAGHNIKLGRGGIREIEFFVQTQQLIYGGRDPDVRSARTCEALDQLARTDRVSDAAAGELADSYRYLREIEHRLQMVDDQQTQTLPKEPDDLAAFAVFCGYADGEAFSDDLRRHLLRVEGHYADLFEEAPALSSGGSLSFTGGEHDPETLETLAAKGFTDPEGVSSRIRGWHHGRYRATRSARAREVLTELTPVVIDAMAATPGPDRAFARFDDFLGRLPAGVQILSLLLNNPALMGLLAEIIGAAPRLADTLSRRPALIEIILDAGLAAEAPEASLLTEELTAQTEAAETLEDVLDAARRWTGDHWFRIGVQLLRGTIPAREAGRRYCLVADIALAALLPRVQADFAERHGAVPGSRFAILALGKLGSRELTATSDLDLVFLYDAPEDSEGSDGDKPLPVSHYFARFAQRLFNALTAPTSEGALFEVDMRLRPFGTQGPLASSFEAFRTYQEGNAWTWERMALTRARFVAGDATLGAEVTDFVHSLLGEAGSSPTLAEDAARMRARMREAHPGRTPWHLKHARGGIVDLEFVLQVLWLKHGLAAGDRGTLLNNGLQDGIERLAAAGALDAGDSATLMAAADLFLTLQGLLRLTTGDGFSPDEASDALKETLATAAARDTFEAIGQDLTAAQAEVARLYDEVIGPAPDDSDVSDA